MWSSWSFTRSATSDALSGLVPYVSTVRNSSPSYAKQDRASSFTLVCGSRKHLAFLWPSIFGPLRKPPTVSISSVWKPNMSWTALLSFIFTISISTVRSLSSEVYERCAMPWRWSRSMRWSRSRRCLPAIPRPPSFIWAVAFLPLISSSFPYSPMSGPRR